MSLMGVWGPINGTSDRSKIDSTSGKPCRSRPFCSCGKVEKIQANQRTDTFLCYHCLFTLKERDQGEKRFHHTTSITITRDTKNKDKNIVPILHAKIKGSNLTIQAKDAAELMLKFM